MTRNVQTEEASIVPLLEDSTSSTIRFRDEDDHDDEEEDGVLARRVLIESKKLWHIVGPSIFSRVSTYSMFVISQAFAGHLGDLELAAFSISANVIIGFNFGLLLGMASALETLCGQAYGAKKYYMLGVYMQRSWIVLFSFCVLLLPLHLFASPLLKLIGQPSDVAELSGLVSLYLIPVHFSFAFQFPLNRFLQSQIKTGAIAWVSLAALVIHVILNWFFMYRIQTGLFAFSGLWEFVKLSVASGVMLCLENWYYRILIVMTGNLDNAEIAVDALSICMSINGWEMMIPLGFFAATGVRVANELGAGNGRGAKFATIISVTTSIIIGLLFWLLIMVFNNQLALIFSSSKLVLQEVDKLSLLLAFTVLLNSIQPILSGVAVGSGWQSYVAYINLGSYYLVGVPLGYFMGWIFNLGVKGIWAGMIGGTAIQTLILILFTIRCDWAKEAEKANMRLLKWGEQKQQH
nr:protein DETOXIFICATION 27-like isoform X2 [Ziziphus jujuba var. spinosa]